MGEEASGAAAAATASASACMPRAFSIISRARASSAASMSEIPWAVSVYSSGTLASQIRSRRAWQAVLKHLGTMSSKRALQFARSASKPPGQKHLILRFLDSADAKAGHLNAAARRSTESARRRGSTMFAMKGGTFEAVNVEHLSQKLLKKARLTGSTRAAAAASCSKLGTAAG